MHSIKELRSEAADLDGKMRQMAKRIREISEEIAERESEFKVGDTITWKFGSVRRKGIIVTVLSGGHYRVRGIRKDGSEGALQKAYSWDKVEREKVEA